MEPTYIHFMSMETGEVYDHRRQYFSNCEFERTEEPETISTMHFQSASRERILPRLSQWRGRIVCDRSLPLPDSGYLVVHGMGHEFISTDGEHVQFSNAPAPFEAHESAG